jgi:ribosomal protein S18 acetylase RimI-like enzyme
MIKEIFIDDLDVFYRLIAEVECGEYFNFDNKNHIDWLNKKISISLNRGVRYFAYYCDEEKPAGYISLLIEDGLEGVPFIGYSCEILQIGIFQEYRRMGLGTELLNYADEFSISSNVNCLYVHTSASNYKVVAFYGKSGFVPLATIPDVFKPNNDGMVCMRKVFKNIVNLNSADS